MPRFGHVVGEIGVRGQVSGFRALSQVARVALSPADHRIVARCAFRILRGSLTPETCHLNLSPIRHAASATTTSSFTLKASSVTKATTPAEMKNGNDMSSWSTAVAHRGAITLAIPPKDCCTPSV